MHPTVQYDLKPQSEDPRRFGEKGLGIERDDGALATSLLMLRTSLSSSHIDITGLDFIREAASHAFVPGPSLLIEVFFPSGLTYSFDFRELSIPKR